MELISFTTTVRLPKDLLSLLATHAGEIIHEFRRNANTVRHRGCPGVSAVSQGMLSTDCLVELSASAILSYKCSPHPKDIR